MVAILPHLRARTARLRVMASFAPVLRSTASRRLLVSLAAGLLVGLLLALLVAGPLAWLAGIAAMAVSFLVTGLVALWPMDPDATADHISSQELSPWVHEVMVLVVVLGGLAGVVALILTADTSIRGATAAVGLLGVFCLWAMLHLMYATRYAHLHLADPDHGIDFNNADVQPCYRDFLYFSYNLGMTYQVSDTDVGSTALRSVILRHCVLSWVFGTVILAATINLVAGIVAG